MTPEQRLAGAIYADSPIDVEAHFATVLETVTRARMVARMPDPSGAPRPWTLGAMVKAKEKSERQRSLERGAEIEEEWKFPPEKPCAPEEEALR